MNARNIAMLLRKGSVSSRSYIQRRNYAMFSKNKQDPEEEQKINPVFRFLRDGWRQTFPKEEDEVKRKYQKVKKMKRYSAQQLAKMQEQIPEYQRTAMVETQIKSEQARKRFKVSNIVPDSIKEKVKGTSSYKQYSDFKQNFKEYLNTSDSAAVNLGNKVINVATQQSSASRATTVMRQYDKEFNLMDLEKQSTFIFKQTYEQFLEGNIEDLKMLCGQSALDLFKSLLKINTVKKVKPKYTQLIHFTPARIKKTLMSENSLPSFLFEMNFIEVYCMIDAEGKIVDGDDERIMQSTYEFLMKYSGEFIGELGHPWQVVEVRKINEFKMLV